MANTNGPFGLKPVKHLNGSSWNGALDMYFIPASDTVAYAAGDVVTTAAGGDPVTGAPAVALAGTRGAALTSGKLLGVVQGFGVAGMAYDPTNLELTAIPATKTKDYYVFVCTGTDVVYEAQTDSLAAADFNKNCPLYVGAAPSGIQRNSNSYAQGSAAGTAATLPLRVIGGVSRVGNDLTASYAKILVAINTHSLGNATAGV
ncbi:hypothetical protein UFOVP67_27 [uncultured Caudovirales phage]|uniref:Uncharacterized protein n=1 Tax=uncultured Caudovirales phage TaxID=2100421 RepID=A0A6J5T8V5_9CAUD|nr:hypothetical protein UFOVP67_27 [uncultured Caudovirales phage]